MEIVVEWRGAPPHLRRPCGSLQRAWSAPWSGLGLTSGPLVAHWQSDEMLARAPKQQLWLIELVLKIQRKGSAHVDNRAGGMNVTIALSGVDAKVEAQLNNILALLQVEVRKTAGGTGQIKKEWSRAL